MTSVIIFYLRAFLSSERFWMVSLYSLANLSSFYVGILLKLCSRVLLNSSQFDLIEVNTFSLSKCKMKKLMLVKSKNNIIETRSFYGAKRILTTSNNSLKMKNKLIGQKSPKMWIKHKGNVVGNLHNCVISHGVMLRKIFYAIGGNIMKLMLTQTQRNCAIKELHIQLCRLNGNYEWWRIKEYTKSSSSVNDFSFYNPK